MKGHSVVPAPRTTGTQKERAASSVWLGRTLLHRIMSEPADAGCKSGCCLLLGIVSGCCRKGQRHGGVPLEGPCGAATRRGTATSAAAPTRGTGTRRRAPPAGTSSARRPAAPRAAGGCRCCSPTGPRAAPAPDGSGGRRAGCCPEGSAHGSWRDGRAAACRWSFWEGVWSGWWRVKDFIVERSSTFLGLEKRWNSVLFYPKTELRARNARVARLRDRRDFGGIF